MIWPDDYLIPGIKPFHQEEAGIIYCGDCRDILPKLPKVDLVLTDPPYGIKRFEKGSLRFDKKNEFPNGILWDKKPASLVFELIFARCNNAIIWGANNFTLPESEYFLVWDKQQTVDNFASAELAFTNIKRPAKIFKYSIHAHNQTDKYHPTQKPIKLFKWCLSFAPNANTILDPFLGSGTTALAAKELGRKFIGIEISEEYCKIAVKRLRQGVLDFG